MQDVEKIERLLECEDARTVANALSALTKYSVTPSVRPLPSLFGSPHNRVAANALIGESVRDLSQEVLTKLEAMIFGRRVDDARRASGLYALGEIARILKERDIVFFTTRFDLIQLLLRAETFVNDKNASVATQASRAVAKVTAELNNDSAA